MKVLVHLCCAPCALAVLGPLAQAGHQLRGFFYNPNVHPFLEFRRRLKAVKVLAETIDVPIHCDETYDLDRVLSRLVGTGGERCAACYRERMGRTAREAADIGFDAFTTTLLASTHRDLGLVRQIAAEAAAAAGVQFLDGDWRAHAHAAHDDARQRQLYRQQYCGCIYSEHERYRNTQEQVYRGGGHPADTDDAERKPRSGPNGDV